MKPLLGPNAPPDCSKKILMLYAFRKFVSAVVPKEPRTIRYVLSVLFWAHLHLWTAEEKYKCCVFFENCYYVAFARAIIMFYVFSLETSLLLFAESVVGGLSTRTLAELLGSSSGPASVGGGTRN